MPKKKPSPKLKTPVLFLIFNRLDTTKQVFEEIRKAKPSQLFIAADGPRTKQEKEKTDKVRKYVLDNIDWKCSVKRLFRKENLGCKKQTISSINWFFENVEKGIILEDDVLPSQDFFKFHEEMLEKYKNKDRIKAICGVNFFGERKTKYSYFFSRIFFSSWGFSTWKRAWNYYEVKVRKAVNSKKKISPYKVHDIILKKKINDSLRGKTSSWAYLFNAQNIIENSLVVVPSKNLAKSIGFIGDSSHKTTKIDRKYLEVERRKLDFPLIHPIKIKSSKKIDRRFIFWFYRKNLIKKLNMFFK